MSDYKPCQQTVYLPDPDATAAFAQQFAPLLCGKQTTAYSGEKGGRIHLHGDLGAGKTSFARALLQACGVRGRIKSPTYALIESYNVSNLQMYHLDFYRFSDTLEWVDAGFRDIFQDHHIILIEWPERAGEQLPPPDMDIALEYEGSGRKAHCVARSERGRRWLSTLTTP